MNGKLIETLLNNFLSSVQSNFKREFFFFFLICCPLLLAKGTGISCKEKIRKENFQTCLSLIFHNYKIIYKVRNNLENNSVPGDHESSLKIFS